MFAHLQKLCFVLKGHGPLHLGLKLALETNQRQKPLNDESLYMWITRRFCNPLATVILPL